MKNKNKAFTVDDFIIFLKSKILIISICTLSLATITILLQNNYTDNWDVKVSRTINKDSVLESISIINQKKTIQARKFDIIPNRVRPIEVLRDIESLIDASLVNYLTNEDISYTEIMDKPSINLFKKEIYQFNIYNTKKYPNENILRRKLDIIFKNTNNLTKDFIEMQYELGRTENLSFYNFAVTEIKRQQGYDLFKLAKIFFFYLVASSFAIFVFDIRKSIKLF